MTVALSGFFVALIVYCSFFTRSCFVYWSVRHSKATRCTSFCLNLTSSAASVAIRDLSLIAGHARTCTTPRRTDNSTPNVMEVGRSVCYVCSIVLRKFLIIPTRSAFPIAFRALEQLLGAGPVAKQAFLGVRLLECIAKPRCVLLASSQDLIMHIAASTRISLSRRQRDFRRPAPGRPEEGEMHGKRCIPCSRGSRIYCFSRDKVNVLFDYARPVPALPPCL